MDLFNKNYRLFIGSHVSLTAPDYLLGSVNEALSYGANALMVYTGAPQNTIRKPTSIFKISEAHELLNQKGISLDKLIIHAPYIINLCSDKNETRLLAIDFLIKELKRCDEIGASYLVLHPGSGLSNSEQVSLDYIIEGLNYVYAQTHAKVRVCLETMAGKGSEVGKTLEQLAYIIKHVQQKTLGVCLDTCHVNDAGYDLSDFNKFLDNFDQVIGLDKLCVIHLNDSKNPCGSHKDRHENIGYGSIGFDTLNQIVWHPKLDGITKILETPYVVVDDIKKVSLPPYKYEIDNFKNQLWIDFKSQMKIKK